MPDDNYQCSYWWTWPSNHPCLFLLLCTSVLHSVLQNRRLAEIIKKKNMGKSEKTPQGDWDWLFNITCNDISVIIYVTANRCAGKLKKLDLWLGSIRQRHFVGFFNVPVKAPTQGHPFYGYSVKQLHFKGPHGGTSQGEPATHVTIGDSA